MDENWHALCISILKCVTPEQAFEYLNPKAKINNCNPTITEDDILDMIELKNTHTYTEIGEMYGLSENAAFKRIKRYLEPKVKKKREPKEGPGIKNCKSGRVICNDRILAEMAALKDSGLSNNEIGERYGIDPEAIRVKIYRYKKKMEKAG